MSKLTFYSFRVGAALEARAAPSTKLFDEVEWQGANSGDSSHGLRFAQNITCNSQISRQILIIDL
jgi:hypothetical protein